MKRIPQGIRKAAPERPRRLGVLGLVVQALLTAPAWGLQEPADSPSILEAAEAAPDSIGDGRRGGEAGVRERADERMRMVEEQIASRGVDGRELLDAMRAVPRHLFVPERVRDRAYADQPLPIGEGQTISQPYIVGFMTELLGLGPEDRVLEVGTGSGYQAAVASLLADTVFTIEIFESLAASAAERLERLGYANVVTRQADGYFGWEEKGPFDAIFVTAAAGHVPPSLVQQLKPGGRMMIPVGGAFQLQHLVLVEKGEQGAVTTRNLLPVRFVPLLGH